MYNNKEISSLSREELAKALQSFHLKSGPITATTRKIFEKRLIQHLESTGILTQAKEEKENPLNSNTFLVGSNGECLSSNGSLNFFSTSLVEENKPSFIVNGLDKTDEKYNDEKIYKIDTNKTNLEKTHDNKENTFVPGEMCFQSDSLGVEKVKPDFTVKVECDDVVRRRDIFVVASCNGDETTIVGEKKSSVDSGSQDQSKTDKLPPSPTSSEVRSSPDIVHLDRKEVSQHPLDNSNDVVKVESLPKEKQASEQQLEKTSDIRTPTRGYYAVWVPFSPLRVSNNAPIICESQQEALTKMKAYKGSRFKVFETREEAESFCITKGNPTEIVKKTSSSVAISTNNIGSSNANSGSSGNISGGSSNGVTTSNNTTPRPSSQNNTTSTTTTSTTTQVETVKQEKVVKVPSFHETIKFRQHIEKFNNKLTDIENCLCNPRYLISSSDIPVILQEGSRMNAVHIAIKCNRLKVLKLIFNYLQSDDFLRLIYPSADPQQLAFRKKHLLNLYLNTPEKILCDTPLHLACKFGFINIVKFLLGFNLLKVDAQNSERKTSKEVVCDRVHARSVADRDKVKNDIVSLFEEKAYIPLYDNEDAMQSKIGDPILTLSPKEVYSSSNLNKVKAFAGPMSPSQATRIFQEWKKSPRNRLHSMVALSDYEKGMERIGRNIASNENVPFTEYWSFLDKYTNFRTVEGLKKLEKYLKSKYTAAIQTDENGQTDSPNIVASEPNSTSKKSKTKIRHGSDTPGDNEKKPEDIKRKLNFEDIRKAYCIPNEKSVKPESTKKFGKKKLSGEPAKLVDIIDKMAEIDISSDEGKIVASHSSTSVSNGEAIFGEKMTSKNTLLNKNGNVIGNISPVDCENADCLSDAFTNLKLSSPENGHLVENGNIDMDLVNQSVSFHLEPSLERVDSERSLRHDSDVSKTNNITVEVNGDSSDLNEPLHEPQSPLKTSNNSLLSDPFEHSPSSYNSPVPSKHLENNMVIPGIINLSGKASDVNCLPRENVFISGNQPSKQDLDVFRALDSSMELESYPHVRRWKCMIESFSEDIKTSWPSPGSPRFLKSKSKRRTSWTA